MVTNSKKQHLINIQALKIIGVIIAITFLFYPSLPELWHRWILWDQDLAHAIPTLFIISYLLLTAQYYPVQQDTYIRHLLAVMLCGLASWSWAIFQTADIALLAQLSIVIAIFSSLSAIFSFQLLTKAWPILALFMFCIPIWDELNAVLVSLSALVVGKLIQLSHLTALIDGKYIHLPFGTIFIADGCSGLRYFIISLLMGCLIGILNQYRKTSFFFALLIFGLIGLIANWIRIYLLVIVGYHSQMTSNLMQDHELFGWILFSIILLPAIYFSPVYSSEKRSLAIAKGRYLLPLLALVSAPLGTLLIKSEEANTRFAFPDQSLPAAHSLVTDRSTPSKFSINHQEQKHFSNINFRIDWLQPGDKLTPERTIPYINNLFDITHNVAIETYTLHQKYKGDFFVEIFKESDNSIHWIGLSQFHIGSTTASSYRKAKLMKVLEDFRGNHQVGLLLIQLECIKYCKEEKEQLSALLGVLDLTPKSIDQ